MKNRAAASGLFLLLLGVSAHAHHSRAVFDHSKPVEIRGRVVEFKLRSPHSSFVIDGAVLSKGIRQGVGVERWEVESESLPGLRTLGIDSNTFQSGDTVRIVALPDRDPDFRYAYALLIIASDGTRYDLGRSDRQFSPSVREAFGAEREALRTFFPADLNGGIEAPKDRPSQPRSHEGVEGRWQQPLTPPGAGSVLPLNDAGMAARSSYDRKLSPANTCEPISIPDAFNAPFYLFDIRIDGQQAVLHNELYDIVRKVPLGNRAAPADSAGLFGLARGRMEDGALVVESRGFAPSKWGLGAETTIFGGGADVPSSEQKEVIERFSVSEDGETLLYEYTVNDPVYMSEPYSGRIRLTRVPDGTPMYPYECDVESASMWSREAGDAPLRVGT
jgi:hypothetical protein